MTNLGCCTSFPVTIHEEEYVNGYEILHHHGGTTPRPGEVTLASRGVLYLDEIAEYPRSTLEVLRHRSAQTAARMERQPQRAVARNDLRFQATDVI